MTSKAFRRRDKWKRIYILHLDPRHTLCREQLRQSHRHFNREEVYANSRIRRLYASGCGVVRLESRRHVTAEPQIINTYKYPLTTRRIQISSNCHSSISSVSYSNSFGADASSIPSSSSSTAVRTPAAAASAPGANCLKISAAASLPNVR